MPISQWVFLIVSSIFMILLFLMLLGIGFKILQGIWYMFLILLTPFVYLAKNMLILDLFAVSSASSYCIYSLFKISTTSGLVKTVIVGIVIGLISLLLTKVKYIGKVLAEAFGAFWGILLFLGVQHFWIWKKWTGVLIGIGTGIGVAVLHHFMFKDNLEDIIFDLDFIIEPLSDLIDKIKNITLEIICLFIDLITNLKNKFYKLKNNKNKKQIPSVPKITNGKHNYYEMREVSNDICLKNAISIIEKNSNSKTIQLKVAIDEAIKNSQNLSEFIVDMQNKDYIVKKTFTAFLFKKNNTKEFINSIDISKDYTVNEINKKINQNKLSIIKNEIAVTEEPITQSSSSTSRAALDLREHIAKAKAELDDPNSITTEKINSRFVNIRSTDDIEKLASLINRRLNNDKSIILIRALIAYIAFECNEDEKNLNTLRLLLNSMELRKDIEYVDAVDLLFKDLEEENPQQFAIKCFEQYKELSFDEKAEILLDCKKELEKIN